MRRLPIVALLLILGFALAAAARAQEGVPAAPTDLTAIPFADATSISIEWRDNAHNEQSYIVERSDFGTPMTWDEIATVPADTESYIDSVGLESGMTYYYRVVAENDAGRSPYSNVVSAKAGFPIPESEPTPTVILPDAGTDAAAAGGTSFALPLALVLAVIAAIAIGWATWRRAA